jgi:hypothetical protein
MDVSHEHNLGRVARPNFVEEVYPNVGAPF